MKSPSRCMGKTAPAAVDAGAEFPVQDIEPALSRRLMQALPQHQYRFRIAQNIAFVGSGAHGMGLLLAGFRFSFRLLVQLPVLVRQFQHSSGPFQHGGSVALMFRLIHAHHCGAAR